MSLLVLEEMNKMEVIEHKRKFGLLLSPQSRSASALSRAVGRLNECQFTHRVDYIPESQVSEHVYSFNTNSSYGGTSE